MALQRFLIELEDLNARFGPPRESTAVVVDSEREVSADEVRAVLRGLGFGGYKDDSDVSVRKEVVNPPTLAEYIAAHLSADIDSDARMSDDDKQRESDQDRHSRLQRRDRAETLLHTKLQELARLTGM